jgi:hypothetical protein
MSILFDLVVLAFILFYAYFGWELGIWTASIASLELLACLILGVLVHEAVAAFLAPWLQMISSDLSTTWASLIAFGGLAWGTFAAIRYRFHETIAPSTEEVDIDPLSDRIGGVIAGAIGGTMLVGGVLITISMTPFLAPMKPSGDRMMLDVGKLVLWTAGHFVTDRNEGQPLPIQGEPASSRTDSTALLTCEPWLDVDQDGEFTDEKDRYRDIDGNGAYSKDLYFVDVDRDGRRRTGVIDKYVVGCWDDQLNTEVRQRTDVKKPGPKTKPTKPGTEENEGEEKPIESDF